jgi:hypothetical protein
MGMGRTAAAVVVGAAVGIAIRPWPTPGDFLPSVRAIRNLRICDNCRREHRGE